MNLIGVKMKLNRSSDFSHLMLAFLACAVILLPAHPSLQFVLKNIGVPSFLVAILLAAPLFLLAPTYLRVSRNNLLALLYILLFIFWMLVSAMHSPVLGSENFLASLRGLFVLTPLSVFCAFIASRSPNYSSVAVTAFGMIAVVHFSSVVLTTDVFSVVASFRSLSHDPDAQNYQSTSFYLGIAGLIIFYYSINIRGIYSMLGLLVFAVVVVLMGLVGARSSVVALCVGLLAIISKSRFDYLIRNLIVIAMAILSAILFILIFQLNKFEELVENLVVIDRFLVLVDEGDSSSRIYLFSSAISMWLESPANFLFGGGLASFPAYISESSRGWYPHNFILESLAEGGIIAGLLLFAIIFQFIVKFKNINPNLGVSSQVYLGALAFYAVAAYQFMGGLETLWIPIFFITLFLFTEADNISCNQNQLKFAQTA